MPVKALTYIKPRQTVSHHTCKKRFKYWYREPSNDEARRKMKGNLAYQGLVIQFDGGGEKKGMVGIVVGMVGIVVGMVGVKNLGIFSLSL